MPREGRPVDDAAYLLDMLEAGRAVARFIAGKTIEPLLPPPPADPEVGRSENGGQ